LGALGTIGFASAKCPDNTERKPQTETQIEAETEAAVEVEVEVEIEMHIRDTRLATAPNEV